LEDFRLTDSRGEFHCQGIDLGGHTAVIHLDDFFTSAREKSLRQVVVPLRGAIFGPAVYQKDDFGVAFRDFVGVAVIDPVVIAIGFGK
jgi:hypothetical protein